MPIPAVRTPEAYNFLSISASGLVKTGPGFGYGAFITASALGIIRFYDNTSAAGTVILDQYPVAAGELVPLPAEFKNGLFFQLVSGTATLTVYFV